MFTKERLLEATGDALSLLMPEPLACPPPGFSHLRCSSMSFFTAAVRLFSQGRKGIAATELVAGVGSAFFAFPLPPPVWPFDALAFPLTFPWVALAFDSFDPFALPVPLPLPCP